MLAVVDDQILLNRKPSEHTKTSIVIKGYKSVASDLSYELKFLLQGQGMEECNIRFGLWAGARKSDFAKLEFLICLGRGSVAGSLDWRLRPELAQVPKR